MEAEHEYYACCDDYVCPCINLSCYCAAYPCYCAYMYLFPDKREDPQLSRNGRRSSVPSLGTPLLTNGAPLSEEMPARKDRYKAPVVNEGVILARESLETTASAVRDAEDVVKENLRKVRAARDELASLEATLHSARADLKTKRKDFKTAHQTHSCFECVVVQRTFMVFLMCLNRRAKQGNHQYFLPQEVLLIIRDHLLNRMEAMSFLCLPVRAPREVPLWKFALSREPSTLMKHVRCWLKESRDSSNDRWFYEFSREATFKTRQERNRATADDSYKDERIFWLSATSRRQRFRQVYDISLVQRECDKNDVSVIARMRSLNVGGTRWILEWVYNTGENAAVPLMGMVYRRNILRNHPTVYELYLPAVSPFPSSRRMQRRKLINVDALSGVRDFLVANEGDNDDGNDDDGDDGTAPSSPPPSSSNGTRSSQVRPVSPAAPEEGSSSLSLAEEGHLSPVDFGRIEYRGLGDGADDETKPPLPEGWMRLHSKGATWNGEAYTLNFGTRVTQASARNSQVTWARVGDDASDDGENEAATDDGVVFQFGRTVPKVTVGDNEYALDFTYPFSPLQAFAVALGLSTRKYAC